MKFSAVRVKVELARYFFSADGVAEGVWVYLFYLLDHRILL